MYRLKSESSCDKSVATLHGRLIGLSDVDNMYNVRQRTVKSGASAACRFAEPRDALICGRVCHWQR